MHFGSGQSGRSGDLPDGVRLLRGTRRHKRGYAAGRALVSAGTLLIVCLGRLVQRWVVASQVEMSKGGSTWPKALDSNRSRWRISARREVHSASVKRSEPILICFVPIAGLHWVRY